MNYEDQDEDTFIKGRPIIRVWELNENSTRYDRIAAAPSDEEMTAYWYAWAVISSLVGIFSMVVFLGILSSKKTRNNAFNLYLLYLMVPDFVFSLCCGVTCLINAVMGQYTFPWMCNFQQWYCVFGISANTWMNMLVAHQIYTMLSYSHGRRRYSTPSLRYVSMQALAVYAFCGFLGTWGLIEKEAFPFHSGAFSGLACLPIETDSASTWFFWFCFIPLFAGIPFAYIGYMSFDIWWRSLMPPTGRRRTLSVYFGRLILVFVVMWIPTFLFLWVTGPWLPPAAHFAAGTWSHLQGAVSAGVSLMKPDIRAAVKNFLRCKCVADEIAPVNAPHVPGRGSSQWNFDVAKSFRSSFRSSMFGSSDLVGGVKKDAFRSGFSADDIILEGDEENQTSVLSLNHKLSSMVSGNDVWPSSLNEKSQPLEGSDANAATSGTGEVSLFGEGFSAELAKELAYEVSFEDLSDELATQDRDQKSAVDISDDKQEAGESVLKSAVGVSDEGEKQEQVVALPSEGVSNEGTKQPQVVSPSSEGSDQGKQEATNDDNKQEEQGLSDEHSNRTRDGLSSHGLSADSADYGEVSQSARNGSVREGEDIAEFNDEREDAAEYHETRHVEKECLLPNQK